MGITHAMGSLKRYTEKRDFSATSEPRGATPTGGDGAPRGRFVVHEHDATSMHWDLRLEFEGVLVSFAIPRGLPPASGTNHFAAHTEDHPLEYLEWSGEIPKGQYGQGSMRIYDTGTYVAHEWTDSKLEIELEGAHVRGRWALFQTTGDDWMIHRMGDPVTPGWQPAPEEIAPMLATASTLPAAKDDAKYAYEIKWDGIRALVWASGGRVDKVLSRNGNDLTAQYPELGRLGRNVGMHQVVLDGEIVALDETGVPSFQRLQQRMGLTAERTIKRRAEAVPATLMLFDVLYLDGHMTVDLAYEERRRLLALLELQGPHWQTPAHHVGDGEALLGLTLERGLEGVVAKRLDSAYLIGKRSAAWKKVRHKLRESFVIGGYADGEGRRGGTFGSVLVGSYDAAGQLVFRSAVGSGFSDEVLASLHERLVALEQEESPFDVGLPEGGRAGKWRAISGKQLSADQSTSWRRSWCVTWSSRSSRGRGPCGTRPSRGCARTSRRPTW